MAQTAPALTHSQRGIWIGQSLAPRSPLYNMAFAFVFPPGVDERAFREAWQRVADASDALRTRIGGDEGQEPRLVLSPGGPSTEIVALEPAGEPEAAFRRWCEERCARPLPLDDSLVDSVLVRFGDGRTGWYLNQHHLVTDAFSTALLYREVGAQYAAIRRSADTARLELPSYYATAAALPSSPRLRADAARHWRSRGERTGHPVTLYGRRTAADVTASTRLTLELGKHRSQQLAARSRAPGLASLSDDVSRFALFASLLLAWLHRIGGEADLGFDTLVSGRPTADARRSPGVFVELFPFATTVERDDTFTSLAAKCLQETSLLLRHALPGVSAPSAVGASNIVLNYVPVAFGPFAGMPVSVEWIHPGHGDAVHALRLQVTDFTVAGAYTLHFDFNDAALEDRLRRRSLAHFESLLDACLDDPDRSIAAIDILTGDERRALAAFNDTSALATPHSTVVDMIAAATGRSPDAVALRQGQTTLTFADLRARANAVACALAARGVAPGDRVAVAGRRSIDVVVAILGTLRARAAYVPIDAAMPRTRTGFVLEDSGARVLLAGDDFDPVHVPPAVPVVRVADAVRTFIGHEPDHAGPRLSDLAYLLYTSGSTGQPKGVLIEHDGLADYLQWAERRYVRGDRLTYPLFTSLGFDLTVTSLFLPLMTGGTLVIYPEPDGPVDSAIVDVIADDAVDFIKLTPSHLSLVRRISLSGSRIRRMVVGGENLKTALAAAVTAQLDRRVEIHNEYGPTEAVVGCIAHHFDPGTDIAASVPIGAPADHVTAEVLNDAGAPVPEGVPGELWISRVGLARGYHGRPELTAERFDEDAHGRRRYRTGDRVRFTDPSTLEYLGRNDWQVKIAGHRVELGEIEAAMLAVPGVEGCAVVPRHRAVPADGAAPVRHCARCGLPSNYPRVTFDPAGICSICRAYEGIAPRVGAYFRSMDDLRALFQASAHRPGAAYDCLMLYSGGKDSTYALCQLVEMGVKVYAFMLDNGFISADAKENIRRVTAHLGVPVEFGSTPGMPEIFRDSLARFSNVCNGCFKTIYTLGMLRARELGIPIIVTGLSRGQMFETRLSEEMFVDGGPDAGDVDAAVLAARKAYHRTPDAVSRVIDVRPLESDDIFHDVQVVDFYRYCDVALDDMLAFLARTVPWIRPADTGRSTNCLINDAGIYVHRQERGYHSYALPYSWDVRLGHKTREAALDELNDEIDPDHVRRMLSDIGYDESHVATADEQTTLAAFYVSSSHIGEAELREDLATRLPLPMVPARFERVDAMPLTPNGKVDHEALLASLRGSPAAREAYVEPDGPVAGFLAGVWREELGLERVGARDHFFELGGTSLSAMQVIVRLCREFDIALPLATIFTHPKLESLARVAEDRILADVSAAEDEAARQVPDDAGPMAQGQLTERRDS
jgi:amino acid adenylation domain-containing protein